MRVVAYTILAVLLAGGPALACSDQPARISGDFQIGEKGWGEADAEFAPKGAEVVFTPRLGTQTARWHAGVELTDIDVCATFVMPSVTADESRSYAGLIFWVTDKDNFHQAVISPNGMFTVARKVNGRILPTAPVSWLPADALKRGPNEKNVLRLKLEGQNVSIEINGQEITRFRGQAPDGPSHVGLVAASSPSAVDTWQVSELKVAEIGAPQTATPAAEPVSDGENTEPTSNATADPPAPEGEVTGAVPAAAEGPCGAGKLLFADDFNAHDPMWGGKGPDIKIADGAAEFDPPSGYPALRWNRAFVFRDLDVCASVKLAKPTVDPTKSYAGLIFWVEDSRNYYQAVVAPNGYFTVARIVDGKVVAKRPVEWTKVAGVKTGHKEENTLRITARGGSVEAFINGKPAGKFTGEPPLLPSYIGMLASSAQTKRGDTWTITDFKVTAPQ